MRPSPFLFHAGHRRKKTAKGLRILALCLISAVLLSVFADRFVSSKAAVLLRQETKSRVLLLLEQASADVMEGRGPLFCIHRNEAGAVTDFSLDAVALQTLKRDLSRKLAETLQDRRQLRSTIPVGSLTGLAFLSGRGFEVPFSIRCLSAPEMKLQSEFLSAGVNQTRCRLLLSLRVQVYGGLFSNAAPCEIESTILLLEQVVVGSVPHYWNGR